MTVIGINEKTLELRLKQIGDRAIKHGVEKMREIGLDMAIHTIKHYTPEDKENLNDAIEVDEGRGTNRRVEVFVGVNLNAPGSGGAQTVREYALRIHNNTDGTYRPGPITQTKSGPSGPAGELFLLKGMLDYEGKFEAILAELYRRQFK